MKKLASLPSFLFSKEQTAALRLQEQPYIILIPKSLIQKCKIYSENLSFDLTISNNRLTLLGPTLSEDSAAAQARSAI